MSEKLSLNYREVIEACRLFITAREGLSGRGIKPKPENCYITIFSDGEELHTRGELFFIYDPDHNVNSNVVKSEVIYENKAG